MTAHQGNKFIITIDGPAGSGKSTTARLVAQRLNYLYLDTGAMYRAITLKVTRVGIKEDQKEKVNRLLERTDVSLQKKDHGLVIFLDDEDVSGLIRTPEIDYEIGWVCQIHAVRERMVALQRKIAKNGGIVAEGRDMGTVVFPAADFKFYMVASVAERARRRWLQMKEKGIEISIAEIKNEIERRDKIDSQRELSPLKKAPDAIEIDTTNVSVAEQTELIVDKVLGKKGESTSH